MKPFCRAAVVYLATVALFFALLAAPAQARPNKKKIAVVSALAVLTVALVLAFHGGHRAVVVHPHPKPQPDPCKPERAEPNTCD